MQMKDFFTNLIEEGQGNVERQMELDHPWIIMGNPIGITDVDSNVFLIFAEAFKWHQYDVTQLLCSLQDIQTWALHRHFASQTEDKRTVREAPILASGQPRYMTSRKFRQLLKKHADIELDWMGVFNHATEMQWWGLLMLRSIVGAISATDKLRKENVDKAEQLAPNERELDEMIAEAKEQSTTLDKVVAAKLAAKLGEYDRAQEDEESE